MLATTYHSVSDTVNQVLLLVGLRSVYWGPSDVLVTVDVGFEPGLDTDEIEELIDEIETELREEQPLVGKVYIEPQRADGAPDPSGT